jgi:hypothetical protein
VRARAPGGNAAGASNANGGSRNGRQPGARGTALSAGVSDGADPINEIALGAVLRVAPIAAALHSVRPRWSAAMSAFVGAVGFVTARDVDAQVRDDGA